MRSIEKDIIHVPQYLGVMNNFSHLKKIKVKLISTTVVLVVVVSPQVKSSNLAQKIFLAIQ